MQVRNNQFLIYKILDSANNTIDKKEKLQISLQERLLCHLTENVSEQT